MASRLYENIPETLFAARQTEKKTPRQRAGSTKSSAAASNDKTQAQPLRRVYLQDAAMSQPASWFQVTGDRILKVSLWTAHKDVGFDCPDDPAHLEWAKAIAILMQQGRNSLQPEIHLKIDPVDVDDLKAAKRSLPIFDFKGRHQYDQLIKFFKATAPKDPPPAPPKLPDVLKVEITNPSALQPPPREIVIKRDKDGNMAGAEVKDA